ncbi:hypothetical protein N6H18_07465 [Reichenbachiella agarivorans]|uniref:DUF4136 domain-containing protein n=1 Tax=Reichenbachiella agarivorans TaxID=2979464 RepID=A0ABY6CTE0_9BACT|nr:hypothetical protein [Reichenbachiella agarivorans]UXP33785.1 hypothetical protein N6H18_07465 [Reichenbachiella agarivorans]
MKNILVVATLIFTCMSCAPKLSFTWTKADYQGAKYKKIAVFSAGKNLEISSTFQDYMVQFLAAEGFTAVSGMSIINPIQMKDLNADDVKRILLKEGVDAVISTVVIDSQKSTNYVQGSASYGYYGGFGGYYGYRYGPAYYQPGYYQESTSFLLENHFYELSADNSSKEDALLWASQSQITDPSNATTKAYARVLIKGLIDDNIIK